MSGTHLRRPITSFAHERLMGRRRHQENVVGAHLRRPITLFAHERLTGRRRHP
jgi:hypothetical protein